MLAQVLPVIDLKQGVVVRAVAGERRRYQPITSRIAGDSRPRAVARALHEQFGFHEVYLADLDAIEGLPPNYSAYTEIADAGLKILLDPGIRHACQARHWLSFPAARRCFSGMVAGLESLRSRDDLEPLARMLAPESGVFSLDLKHSRPVTEIAEWRDRSPLAIAALALDAGFRRLIVLDLAAVGTASGPATLALCRQLRHAYPDIELISGGGIRSTDDVRACLSAGCSRVLVASALHDGSLSDERS